MDSFQYCEKVQRKIMTFNKIIVLECLAHRENGLHYDSLNADLTVNNKDLDSSDSEREHNVTVFFWMPLYMIYKCSCSVPSFP